MSLLTFPTFSSTLLRFVEILQMLINVWKINCFSMLSKNHLFSCLKKLVKQNVYIILVLFIYLTFYDSAGQIRFGHLRLLVQN